MATQGVLSVVDENGKTLVKVICGCDGMEVYNLAKSLKISPTLDLIDIYNRAGEWGLGCSGCLVVMNAETEYHKCGEKLHPRYRETFSDPRFNPRWELGTAPYITIVEHIK